MRWPWTFGSFLQGMYFGWRSRTKAFKVTPKGARKENTLSPRWLLPMFVLGAVPAWVVILTSPSDLVLGPALLCIIECATYLLAMLAIMALHLARNYRFGGGPLALSIARRRTRHSVTLGVTILFLATLLTLTELALRIAHGLL